MKLTLLLTAIMISLGCLSQQELPSQNLASIEQVNDIEGNFKFTVDQDEYFVSLSTSSKTFQETDDQGSVIADGQFVTRDTDYLIIPQNATQGSIVRQNMRFEIITRTSTNIEVEVYLEDNSSEIIVLTKI